MLQGIAASKRVPSFFLALLNDLLILFVFRIDEVDTLWFSSIVVAQSCVSCFLAAFDMAIQNSDHKQSGLVVAWIFVRRSRGPQKSWRRFLI